MLHAAYMLHHQATNNTCGDVAQLMPIAAESCVLANPGHIPNKLGVPQDSINILK